MVEGEPGKSLEEMTIQDLRNMRRSHDVSQAQLSAELAQYYPDMNRAMLGQIEKGVVRTTDDPEQFKCRYLDGLARINDERLASTNKWLEELKGIKGA